MHHLYSKKEVVAFQEVQMEALAAKAHTRCHLTSVRGWRSKGTRVSRRRASGREACDMLRLPRAQLGPALDCKARAGEREHVGQAPLRRGEASLCGAMLGCAGATPGAASRGNEARRGRRGGDLRRTRMLSALPRVSCSSPIALLPLRRFLMTCCRYGAFCGRCAGFGAGLRVLWSEWSPTGRAKESLPGKTKRAQRETQRHGPEFPVRTGEKERRTSKGYVWMETS